MTSLQGHDHGYPRWVSVALGDLRDNDARLDYVYLRRLAMYGGRTSTEFLVSSYLVADLGR